MADRVADRDPRGGGPRPEWSEVPETFPAAATVTIYPDGPLVLRGDFEVRHCDGTVVPTGRLVALCRCGRSAVKPLCDGSHQRAGRRRTDREGLDQTVPPAVVRRSIGCQLPSG